MVFRLGSSQRSERFGQSLDRDYNQTDSTAGNPRRFVFDVPIKLSGMLDEDSDHV